MTEQDPLRVPARLRSRFDEVVARTDAFAVEHLTPEYADLCRRMAAALARKRPSPLESGQARTWAAGILYAVGWVNFLSDPSQDPHMSTPELARRTGVGESTIAAQFRKIRQALDLARLDPEWTLPSKLADHPFAWMLLVNGIPVDVRQAPREVQEEAFRLGLIPFVPADGAPVASATGGTSPAGRAEERVYQLKITLEGLRPAIWRRVLVPEDATLAGLHRVIQAAMGWEDYHLWRFEIGDAEFEDDPEAGPGVRSARRTRLNEVAGPGDVLLYEYDFGDSWEHRVRVEKVLPAEPGRMYPVCVAAELAAPPEDSGGVWGYVRLLEVLADPDDPEHEDMLEWVGGEFDPDAVDLDEINRRLALTRPREEEGAGAVPARNPAEAAMREVTEILQRALEENPDATLEDLNAVLETASAGYNARAQPELGGLSPAEMHRLLNADWDGEGSAVRLDGSLPLAELDGSRTLHNARLLLALLAERGQVKATPKGNLPRPVVAELRAGMRWPEGHREEWYAERKVVNEEDVFSLHLTRILLEVAGLLKLRKGVFSLTRAGERLRDESRAGELFATLFRTHFRKLNLALLDGVGSAPGFQHTIAYPLYRFGQVGGEWRTPAELMDELVLPPVRHEVPPGPLYDPLETVLEHRLLRPLEGFGLAELQVVPREPGSWSEVRRYRKNALFDRLLRFDLAAG